MKIGIALSGCGSTALASGRVLAELATQGVKGDLIAVTGRAAAGALLYSYGLDTRNAPALELVLNSADPQHQNGAAEDLFDGYSLPEREPGQFAIVCTEITSGRMVICSDRWKRSAKNPVHLPLPQARAALCGTMARDQAYEYAGLRLCDYAIAQGIPIAPLRMAGMERVLSITFSPEAPATPYEVGVTRLISYSAGAADIHRAIPGPPEGMSITEYEDIATNAIRDFIKEIHFSTLF